MPAPIALFRPGDVARCGHACGIVVQADATTLLVAMLVRAPTPRHRADVALDALADMVAAGVAGRDLVVRAAVVRRVPRDRQTNIGRVRPALMQRVRAAMLREAEAQMDESKWRATARG